MPGYPNDIYPLSMQTKRIFCAYHETQFLTNFCQQSKHFCNQEQCLMPLCPSCIAEHTQQHFQEGKKPSYTNINQALNKAKQSCYCTIVTLQEYKRLNQDVFDHISTLEQNIHLQISSKKNQLFDLISQLFADYESRLIKQIHEGYIQKNVYSIDQSVNASKFIDEQISNLYEKISLLKGDQCLSALITYYAVDQHNYKQALEQFDDYFQKNRKAGKIQISIIEQNLNKLTTNFCDTLLSVQSIIQNFQKKPQQPFQVSGSKSKRYGFNKSPSANPPGRISRRTIFDKQNEQSNLRGSLRNSQKKNKIDITARNDKQISFNGQMQTRRSNDARKQGPIIRNINESVHNQSLSRRKSGADSKMTQNYESKRLIRNFKRPV